MCECVWRVSPTRWSACCCQVCFLFVFFFPRIQEGKFQEIIVWVQRVEAFTSDSSSQPLNASPLRKRTPASYNDPPPPSMTMAHDHYGTTNGRVQDRRRHPEKKKASSAFFFPLFFWGERRFPPPPFYLVCPPFVVKLGRREKTKEKSACLSVLPLTERRWTLEAEQNLKKKMKRKEKNETLRWNTRPHRFQILTFSSRGTSSLFYSSRSFFFSFKMQRNVVSFLSCKKCTLDIIFFGSTSNSFP